MRDRAAVSIVVLEKLREVCPGALAQDPPPDDTLLGGDLGLDSIEVVEVAMACEGHYGTPVAGLLDGPALTIGNIVDHFSRE